jgi:hypothetical protein
MIIKQKAEARAQGDCRASKKKNAFTVLMDYDIGV